MQDDPHNATDTYGRFFSFRHPGTPTDDQSLTKHTISPNLTADDASPYVLTHTPSHFQRMIGMNYSYGFETDEGQLKRNDADHTKVCRRKSKFGYRDFCASSRADAEVDKPARG
jgi:phospholipid:diacylglycerol acyltransferase